MESPVVQEFWLQSPSHPRDPTWPRLFSLPASIFGVKPFTVKAHRGRLKIISPFRVEFHAAGRITK